MSTLQRSLAGFIASIAAAACSVGLTQAPECAPGANINSLPPGERLELNNLAAGNHRFQCCFHPWMRALIKVG